MKITKAELEAKDTEIRTLTTQLAQAGIRENTLQTQLRESKEAAEKAKAERESMKWSCEHNSKRADEATTELEQLHALLDAFPDCPSREIEDDEKKRDSKPEKRTAMTRLASWLVLRAAIVAGIVKQ